MTTTKTAHTPGPWHISYVEKNGFEHVHVNFTSETRDKTICDLFAKYKHFADCTSELNEETEANARLIAAAPELLSCLKELLECYGHLDDGQCEEFTLARLAVAKAEGR